MLKRKKGQNTAGGAAGFIAIIAGALLLYIFLVPPDVREELLQDDPVTGPGNGVGPGDDLLDGVNRTLLDKSPGRISYLRFDEYEHNLPSINLYSEKSAKERSIGTAIYVKSGIFDKKDETVSFSVEDDDLVDNIYLYFNLNENRNNKGELSIYLNDKKIFGQEVGDTLSGPISVNKEDIKRENTLRFEVSGVGWKFWTTNEYEINNLRIFYDERDISRQRSTNTFIVGETEKFNMDRASLRFNADCNQNTAGVLEITINNQQVYSSVPDCGQLNRVDLTSGMVNAGKNTVTFEGMEGRFLISHINVKTEMKEMTYPVYYFEIDDKFFDNGKLDDRYDIWLNFRFLDDGERKSARVFINGYQFYMETRGDKYERRINSYVEEGSNAIKIEPDQSMLDIINMKAEIDTRN